MSISMGAPKLDEKVTPTTTRGLKLRGAHVAELGIYGRAHGKLNYVHNASKDRDPSLGLEVPLRTDSCKSQKW